MLEVEEIDDEAAANRSQQNANKVITEREADKQLKANTLREKVWLILGRLDSLGGIIAKIDELAKVRGLLRSHGYLTHSSLTYQLNAYLDFTWQLCSSLYKVRVQRTLEAIHENITRRQ